MIAVKCFYGSKLVIISEKITTFAVILKVPYPFIRIFKAERKQKVPATNGNIRNKTQNTKIKK